MKVYMVYEIYAYDSSSIIGVFKSKDSAEAAKKAAETEFITACRQAFDHMLESGDLPGDSTFNEYLAENKDSYSVDIEQIEVQE